MGDYRRPGVYVEERLLTNIEASTAAAATLFVGAINTGPTTGPVRVETWSDFVNTFGDVAQVEVTESNVLTKYTTYLPYAVYSYFQNGGRPAYIARAIGTVDGDPTGSEASLVVPGKSEAVNVTDLSANILGAGTAESPYTVEVDLTISDSSSYEEGDLIDVNLTAVDGADNASLFNGLHILSAAPPSGTTIRYTITDEDVVDSIINLTTSEEEQVVTTSGIDTAFSITYSGQNTGSIATNASAATVQSALEALSNIGTGNVTVARSGASTGNYVYTLTFAGSLADTNVAAVTIRNAADSGAYAGAGTIVVTTPTPGGVLTDPYAATTVTGSLTAPDYDAPVFTLEAKSVGTWANFGFITGGSKDGTAEGLAVNIAPATLTGTYNIDIYQDGVLVERFRNVTYESDPASGLRTIEEAINDENLGSQLVKVVDYVADSEPHTVLVPAVPDWYTVDDYAWVQYRAFGAFGAGTNDAGVNPDLPSVSDMTNTAIAAVGRIEQPLLINIPGYLDANGNYTTAVLGSSDFPNRTDVFIVNDGVQDIDGVQTAASYISQISATTALGANYNDSRVAAFTPWLKIPDPKTNNSIVNVPPGGSVCGVISRIDSTIGTFRAPAGVIATVNNGLGARVGFSDDQLGDLNAANINVIRSLSGVGLTIMGARTRKPYGVDRYISGRRTLIYIEESLRRSTQFALFENNSERLWSTLRYTCESFLRGLWESGGLRGANTSEAYFVKCDETINTPAVISSGEVRVDVGVALEYPAEFVIIRLSQFERGGYSATILNNQA